MKFLFKTNRKFFSGDFMLYFCKKKKNFSPNYMTQQKYSVLQFFFVEMIGPVSEIKKNNKFDKNTNFLIIAG